MVCLLSPETPLERGRREGEGWERAGWANSDVEATAHERRHGRPSTSHRRMTISRTGPLPTLSLSALRARGRGEETLRPGRSSQTWIGRRQAELRQMDGPASTPGVGEIVGGGLKLAAPKSSDRRFR